MYYRERSGGASLVRCDGCGLVFEDPQPDDAVLGASYYHDPAFTELLDGTLRDLTFARAREKRDLLAQAGKIRSGMTALDVGCSSGAWLEVAAASGLDAEGIEPGSATAALARSRGLRVREGTLEQTRDALNGRRFDLITFWDVLEHVRDPRRELRAAADLLAPGGVVAATFPNVDGWYPRVTHRLVASRTGVWEHPELPLHMYEFSARTAVALLERQGLRVETVRTIPIPFSHYRATSLSMDRLGRGARGVLLRLAFELLRAAVYPAARVSGHDNSLFLLAAPGHATATDQAGAANSSRFELRTTGR